MLFRCYWKDWTESRKCCPRTLSSTAWLVCWCPTWQNSKESGELQARGHFSLPAPIPFLKQNRWLNNSKLIEWIVITIIVITRLCKLFSKASFWLNCKSNWKTNMMVQVENLMFYKIVFFRFFHITKNTLTKWPQPSCFLFIFYIPS